MKTVYKYPIQVLAHQRVRMPKGARILTVQAQQGVGTAIWAEVEPDAPQEIRNFLIVGTGCPMPQEYRDLAYIGTFQAFEGAFVGHLYEGTND